MHHRRGSGVVGTDLEREDSLCRTERVGRGGHRHAIGVTTGHPETLSRIPSNGVLLAQLGVDGEWVIGIEREAHEQVCQWLVDFAVVGIGHCDSLKGD
ncbi:unannotated protein [freshwater metagenome]|uniref:Unannotated protein n=1 Tax=freshwater metagenome TaxID=449393 RepID=A0A6J7N1C4_9ZZZZ